MAAHAVNTLSFAFIAASATLGLIYLLIVTELVNRAVVALLGACLLIVMGVLSQEDAYRAIDFNTIGLLVGMMIVVAVARKSGLFGYVAIRAAQAAKASPAGILMALAVVTALFSTVLNNVTTVLLVVPVTFVICGQLKVPVYPLLFADVFASNIGGTATLIGDPPNIMIGSAAHLTFNDFLVNVAPVVAIVFAVQLAINQLIWGLWMRAKKEDRAHVMALRADDAIEDRRLLRWSLRVLAILIVAFVFEDQLHLQAATIAMFGGAAMLLIDNLPRLRRDHAQSVAVALNEVEWITIFFFIGLFVVVGAVERAGVLQFLADRLVAYTGGDGKRAAVGILWGSALLSALVDNITFVATMIPIIKSLAPHFGGDQAVLPLWWSLALGACLGGNGTLVGASPNLVVAGLAEKNGVRFSFIKFTLIGLPMMLISIAICHYYILWRYF